jgi:hypothetical protein
VNILFAFCSYINMFIPLIATIMAVFLYVVAGFFFFAKGSYDARTTAMILRKECTPKSCVVDFEYQLPSGETHTRTKYLLPASHATHDGLEVWYSEANPKDVYVPSPTLSTFVLGGICAGLGTVILVIGWVAHMT